MNGFISERLALVESCEYVISLFKEYDTYDITVTGSMIRVKAGPIEVYGRGWKYVRQLLEAEAENFFQGVA